MVGITVIRKYFIFALASAKHQALYAVTAWRRDLIYPAGKGVGSMLNAFIAHALQTTAVTS
ncbi:hypothetical protein EH206_20375 [Brenneria nigrifluens DSM 30175 = ATCC 13028]|uniref:Uncharacterized protein n=1 Tax=Brenneria nigrifluens DSM 30175 = ATCC 13028 TaxID=1121120 RepID=A0A2U1UIP0_9GAMM|nr:hypothetical protein DDT54_18550 [Brenneria nigrifluens DSM 30175 = ATCC 13028]QCR06296.1 hypothetical protein EH206_20375 [Brenneria nigrifluens DSM 30175 = ATCC 13028]